MIARLAGWHRHHLPPALAAVALSLLLALSAAAEGPSDAPGPGFVLEDSATGAETRLDTDALRRLPLTDYVTGTVWTDAVHRYTGVLLRDLLLQAGIDPAAGNGSVTVHALDGYSATIAFEEVTDTAPMLAFLRNGMQMPLRAQGPFWLIYPYDDVPAFQTETTYARSVWQVSRLRVER